MIALSIQSFQSTVLIALVVLEYYEGCQYWVKYGKDLLSEAELCTGW